MNMLDVFRVIVAITSVMTMLLIVAAFPKWRGQSIAELMSIGLCGALVSGCLGLAVLGRPLYYAFAALWAFTGVMRIKTFTLNQERRRSAGRWPR